MPTPTTITQAEAEAAINAGGIFFGYSASQRERAMLAYLSSIVNGGTGGSVNAIDLTGTTLAPGVTISSLTQLGVLDGLNDSGAFALSGRSDSTIAADQNNFTPAGLASAAGVFVDGGAADRNITGLTGLSAGRIIIFANKGATNNLVLKHASGSSSVGNRFTLPGSTDITITPASAVVLIGDSVANAWKLVGSTGGTAGAAPAGTLTGTTLAANVVTSSITTTGTLTAFANNGAFTLSGRSDVTISADQNNWNPSGVASATQIYVNGGAADRLITGLLAGASNTPGRVIYLTNVGTTNLITLDNNSASSTASNRFTLQGADLVLAPGASVQLKYDGTSSIWRTLGQSPGFSSELLQDLSTLSPTIADGISIVLALSQNSTVANTTGALTNGKIWRLRVKSTVQRTLAWGAMYRGSIDIALPTTTSGSSLTDIYTFLANSTDGKLDFLGSVKGF